MYGKYLYILSASLIVLQKTFCKRQYFLTKTRMKVCTYMGEDIKLVSKTSKTFSENFSRSSRIKNH